IPKIDDLIDLTPKFETNPENFQPYSRDPVTLARPWAIPGTPGLEHKIGGLEKENLSGNISYDPANHDYMVKIRAKKVENIANDINTAVHNMRSEGLSVSHLHLRYLNPLPENVGQILNNFKQILVPEINLG
ncbi:MAG: 2-oxoglutarate ferredoxin oxidoreductase subunit alpha, partial [Bacteroidetes bacterium]|nr:2-oxoglutarate ferredoxin oxidoreductase subunit alpha [Bacteroidota bacterium]